METVSFPFPRHQGRSAFIVNLSLPNRDRDIATAMTSNPNERRFGSERQFGNKGRMYGSDRMFCSSSPGQKSKVLAEGSGMAKTDISSSEGTSASLPEFHPSVRHTQQNKNFPPWRPDHHQQGARLAQAAWANSCGMYNGALFQNKRQTR